MSFFDKIGNGVVEAGNSISQKAKDISEQTRISGEINRYKAQKEEYIKKLGETVYEAKEKGEEPDIEEILASLRETDMFIKNLTNSLNDVKGIMSCGQCGSEIPRDSLFCPNCGQKVESQTKLICPKCSRELELGTKFCVGCGTKVG